MSQKYKINQVHPLVERSDGHEFELHVAVDLLNEMTERIEFLEKEDAELREELEKEREVVDFYADRSSWCEIDRRDGHIRRRIEMCNPKDVQDFEAIQDFVEAGCVARQRQKERNYEL